MKTQLPLAVREFDHLPGNALLKIAEMENHRRRQAEVTAAISSPVLVGNTQQGNIPFATMAGQPHISKLRQQLTRFHLSSQDFIEALSYLYVKPKENDVVTQRALLTAAIIAYARPFANSRSATPSNTTSMVSLKPKKLLAPEQLELHERLLYMRNKAVAHSSTEVRPVLHVAHRTDAFTVGHLVFDPVTQPIDRPLFGSNCELFYTECEKAVTRLSAKIYAIENGLNFADR